MDKHTITVAAEKTFSEFIESLDLVPVKVYNTVPFAGSWTPGQLAQHVILSASAFVELLTGPLEKMSRDPEQHVQLLTTLFQDFKTKMKSPDFILPEEKQYDQRQHLQALSTIQANLLSGITTADLTMLCTRFELPNLGYLSGAEAVTFVTVHTERHLKQLRNIITCLSGN